MIYIFLGKLGHLMGDFHIVIISSQIHFHSIKNVSITVTENWHHHRKIALYNACISHPFEQANGSKRYRRLDNAIE